MPGDDRVLGGRKRTLAEEGPERVKVFPAHAPESRNPNAGGQSIAGALEGMHVTLVVGDREMDAYLKVKTRELITQDVRRAR